MDNTALSTLIALLLPLAGTTLGSAFVFFLKKNMGELLQKALWGSPPAPSPSLLDLRL